MAVNRYYSPVHIGPERGWRINKGDRFQNFSVLFNPRSFPLAMRQVAGYPMMITETHWVPPLGYQSEATVSGGRVPVAHRPGCRLLVRDRARAEWSNHQDCTVGLASRAKWTIATPMILGQLPAAALLFRRGDVSTGAAGGGRAPQSRADLGA